MLSARSLAAAAGLAALIAAMPGAGGVGASSTDGDRLSAGVVCAGDLHVAITGVDGATLAQPTKWTALRDPPTGSAFAITHTFTLHNFGTAPVRSLSLVTLPGWSDSDRFAARVAATVSISADGFVTSAAAAPSAVSVLESNPGLRLPLLSALLPSGDLEIRVRLAASGLDNSFQGLRMRPSFVFVAGG
jgi:hypothetical protein